MKYTIAVTCGLAALLLAAVILGSAVAQLDREGRFDDIRNDGIFVGAPEEWRWARAGTTREAIVALAGSPSEVHEAVPSGSLTRFSYATPVDNAKHSLLLDDDGLLVSAHWYEGVGTDPELAAPVPAIEDGWRVPYPRCVPMAWDGAGEEGFHVEVQDRLGPGNWGEAEDYYTKSTRLVHQHTGRGVGRWRVRAISSEGAGRWSEYVTFRCTR